MCWETSKRPVKNVAENKILVYKFISKKHGIFCSPYYNRNVVFNSIMECNKDFFESEINHRRKCHGFHSYYPESVSMAVIYCDVLVFNKYNNALLDNWTSLRTSFGKMYFVKCYIPEGATYFINEDGEVISDKIIVTKEYATVEKIVKREIYKSIFV